LPARGRDLQRRTLYRRVGARIRALRLEKGLTQEELGDGLSRAHVSAIELGQAAPSLETLQRFARRLRVEIRELLPPGR
jgi:transcriptional regulator with XRE-family HTH domain